MFKSTCPSKSSDHEKWGGYGGGKDKWNDCDDKYGKYDKYEDCDSKYDKYDDCDDKYGKCDDKWDGGYGGKSDDWSYNS